jgi:uncharacterized membrane protein
MNRSHTQAAVVAAALAVGLLAPTTAQATPHAALACTAVALPTPAGTSSAVSGGDVTGRYLVGSVSYPDHTVGALWHDGQYTEIDASSIPNIQIDLHDVSRHGVVVGERMTDYTTFHTDAFTYRDGTFTFLPALHPGDTTRALGINSRGDVVGSSDSDAGGGWVPVVWPADKPGTVRALPVPPGTTNGALARGIDDDGAVAGVLSPFPPGTAYLWPARGNPRALPVPAGSAGSDATAIQGGMVAGSVYDQSTNSSVMTLWNLRTGAITRHTGVHGDAVSVNGGGTIGTAGAIVHADGRVSTLASGSLVTTIAATGEAAGTTQPFHGQATRWLGC